MYSSRNSWLSTLCFIIYLILLLQASSDYDTDYVPSSFAPLTDLPSNKLYPIPDSYVYTQLPPPVSGSCMYLYSYMLVEVYHNVGYDMHDTL